MTTTSTNKPVNIIDTITIAQEDMRKAYANGSVGMIVSGLVWLTSAIVSTQLSDKQAIWTLFIGGMLIHPLSVLLCKLMKLSGQHTKGNPLGNLAMEGTVFMLVCLPLAYGLSLQNTEWFFQAMLLVIGGRYLTFATIYGTKLFWAVGAVLGIAAYMLFSLKVLTFGSALAGGLIEIVFGLYILINFLKKKQS